MAASLPGLIGADQRQARIAMKAPARPVSANTVNIVFGDKSAGPGSSQGRASISRRERQSVATGVSAPRLLKRQGAQPAGFAGGRRGWHRP